MSQEFDVDGVVDFLRQARRLQITYRFTPKPDGGYENDAEHSWSVALICMLVAGRVESELGVELDLEKMLKMSLIHDMAEIETGDTKTWDKKARVGKEERERKALYGLTEGLPDDLKIELRDLWEECEARNTYEAMIVKSIDRFDPVIHRTVFGLGWDNVSEKGAHGTVEALDSRQLPRHKFSRVLTEIYESVRDEAVSKDMFKASG